MPRILLTNDDGIHSTGLHVLARAMRVHGDVVVAAPDAEYSGSGAALGALHLLQPEVRRVSIDGLDDVWTVNGPPALCVMYARLGVFGPFDLVVSGINPGANVGRAIYHSGTVGAAITARSGGVSGVAVSQAVAGMGVEGQGRAGVEDGTIGGQRWETAAAVASEVVGAILAADPETPVVANVNVPNVALEDIAGWRHAEIGSIPPRAVATGQLEPIPGSEGVYTVRMRWGDQLDLPAHTDGGAVERNEVTVTYLSRILAEHRPDLAAVDAALDGLLRQSAPTLP